MAIIWLFFALGIAQCYGQNLEIPIYTPQTWSDVTYWSLDLDGYRLEKRTGLRAVLNKTASILYRPDGTMSGVVLEGETYYELDAFGNKKELDISGMENFTDVEPLIPKDVERQLLHSEYEEDEKRQLKVQPFFPGCYISDNVPRTFSMGIVADRSFYEKLHEDEKAVQQFIENMVINARLVYYRQMNVVLQIGSIRVIKDTGPANYPLNAGLDTCTKDPYTYIRGFTNWVQQHPDVVPSNGVEHLMTGCWGPYGVVGVAYLGSLCGRSGYQVGVTTELGPRTWLIFAHELGHNFGASHTFQNGVGQTGGLMDYGNPYFEGEIQFNTLSKEEMCTGIGRALSSNCPAFQIQSSSCGDQLLDTETEECECAELGKTDCGVDDTYRCISCHLKTQQECSASSYMIRPKVSKSRYLPVTPFSLDDPQCCTLKGFSHDARTSCGTTQGVCNAGKCLRICSLYLLESCPIRNGGCLQPCKMKDAYGRDVCLPTLHISSQANPITWLPDGSPCADGYCKQGECVNGTAPAPTLEPTKRPTRRRRRRRRSPTRRPRRYRPRRGLKVLYPVEEYETVEYEYA